MSDPAHIASIPEANYRGAAGADLATRLRFNPDSRKELDDVGSTHGLLYAHFQKQEHSDKLWQAVQAGIAPATQSTWYNRLPARGIALACAAALIAAIILQPQIRGASDFVIQNKHDQQIVLKQGQTVTLQAGQELKADGIGLNVSSDSGAQVSVNAATSFHVPAISLHQGRIRVAMPKGDGLDRFGVRTSVGDFVVTGTVFSLKRDSISAVLGVNKGEVRWRPALGHQDIPIRPGSLFRVIEPKQSERGLLGIYYSDATFTTPVMARIDADINFDWSTQVPTFFPNNAQAISTIWTGALRAPRDGSYQLIFTIDDEIECHLNNQRILKAVKPGDTGAIPAIVRSAGMSLKAGEWYPIRIAFSDYGNHAVAKMHWSINGDEKVVVPASALRPNIRFAP